MGSRWEEEPPHWLFWQVSVALPCQERPQKAIKMSHNVSSLQKLEDHSGQIPREKIYHRGFDDESLWPSSGENYCRTLSNCSPWNFTQEALPLQREGSWSEDPLQRPHWWVSWPSFTGGRQWSQWTHPLHKRGPGGNLSTAYTSCQEGWISLGYSVCCCLWEWPKENLRDKMVVVQWRFS